eukprot:TRINITY_DN2035_c0_g1_i2.p1 TRINITY_DN2035_c0_g1~~TRINITY_DN2035_c0_g1_i2.p1  ORF type:complete len:553 (+),score=148.55 TRINITY_DN2035_c0_g1_i2:31-1689(+)
MSWRPQSAARRQAEGGPPGTGARPSSKGGRNVPGGGGGGAGGMGRPTTAQQGLPGNPTATGSGKRDFEDSSFFVSLLRSKLSLITEETQKLTAEANSLEDDDANLGLLQKKHEASLAEVRGRLQKLSDLNLCWEKIKVSADPETIREEAFNMKSDNESNKRIVDGVFTNRSRLESDCHHIEDEILSKRDEAETIMTSLPPDRQEYYQDLKKSNNQLLNDIDSRKRELQDVTGRIRAMESDIRADPAKRDAVALKDLLNDLRAERDEIMGVGPKSKNIVMSPEEERKMLLEAVRTDNQIIQEKERELDGLHDQIDRMRADLDLYRESDPNDERAKKLEQLNKKDEEYQEFLETFDESRANDLNIHDESEETIVALLRHISKAIVAERNMPNRKEMANLKSDLEFKTGEMENAEQTMTLLQTERKDKEKELSDMQQLDQKINSQLEALNKKIDSMNADIMTFHNIESATAQAQEDNKILRLRHDSSQMRRDSIKADIVVLQGRLDNATSALARDEVSTQMLSMEEKIKQYEQSVYSLTQYVDARKRERDRKTHV